MKERCKIAQTVLVHHFLCLEFVPKTDVLQLEFRILLDRILDVPVHAEISIDSSSWRKQTVTEFKSSERFGPEPRPPPSVFTHYLCDFIDKECPALTF